MKKTLLALGIVVLVVVVVLLGLYLVKPNSTGQAAAVTATQGFTLASSPATLTGTLGSVSPLTVNVSVAPTNGFKGSVVLTASGSCGSSGITCKVNGTPVSLATNSGTASVSVTPSATTPVGTYTITITGSSGAISNSTSVVLKVNYLSDFSVSPSAGSLAVKRGSSGSITIAVAQLSNTLPGNVSFSVAGLPAQTTSSFTPVQVSTPGATTLTISAATAAKTGTYTITVTAKSGAVVHTATFPLSIN